MLQHTYTQPEEWRPIPGYEGLYEVSDTGKVKRIPAIVDTVRGPRPIPGRTLVPYTNRDGYEKVSLSKDGNKKSFFVHQLVLRAFVRNEKVGEVCCHNDGNPSHNHLSNLRWDTYAGNIADEIKHGTHVEARKTSCPVGHPLSGRNLDPGQLNRHGKRRCLACQRAHGAIQGRKQYKVIFKQLADLKYQDIINGTKTKIYLADLLAAAQYAKEEA
ncbi:NUMOD4 domain-containing protein [Corynebacterium aurimucosum]|uniref:NUMOD4 domain-containing protein n=1 Tax=Corynebacterium aurimucosum TaxID=169292 RepID=UPI0001BCEFBE|nr:NUMOD4 domain-containing protein [Corynebacterium aurimucosum]QQU92278.1 hypothetical protein I6I67_08515 [Corynebacterium aurimucosum]QQU92350.1 hypothetical protein I6I67_08875 [Corynebacterium aurimucosum]